MTSVHAADDDRIMHKECKSLAAAGHDVALVAGDDRTDSVDGVPVIGVGLTRNRLDRMVRIAWLVYRAARRERADIYQFHDPELLWLGLLLKLHGNKVVYDVHEDVPEQIMNKFWIPTWARRLLSMAAMLVERLAARAFDGVVAATPTIARNFQSRKTVVVRNFPESKFARPNSASLALEDRPHAFAYTGGLTEVQGVREIIATAELLPDEMRGVVAGWFDDDDLEREIRASRGWQVLNYVGMLTRPEVIATIRTARCGIILDHPISNYLESHSTKMYEYMASGLPIICSNFPLWERQVNELDCGIAVDPLDPPGVAEAIQRLTKDPDEARRLGENGRRAIIERLNWETEFSSLQHLYQVIT